MEEADHAQGDFLRDWCNADPNHLRGDVVLPLYQLLCAMNRGGEGPLDVRCGYLRGEYDEAVLSSDLRELFRLSVIQIIKQCL